jgi:WD40 repeat protein
MSGISATAQTTLTGHTDHVTFVCFLADGKTVMSGAEDHTVRLWDSGTGAERSIWQKTGEFDEKAPSTSILALSGDGRVLARAGGPQGSAELWDVSRITRIKSINAHDRPVYGVALSGTGGVLATFSSNEAKAWDAGSGRLIGGVQAPNLYVVRAVAVSNDGKLFAVATSDKHVTVYELGKGSLVAEFDAGPGQIHALAISPDSRLIAVGRDGSSAGEIGDGSSLLIWEFGTKKSLEGIVGPSRFARAVAFSSDTRLIAAAGLSVQVLDSMSHKLIQTLPGDQLPIRSVAFSADGHTLATASENNLVGLWKVGEP